MKELGLWPETSLRYKVLSSLERKAGLEADVVLTGTQHMVDELLPVKQKGKVLRAPTAVNEDSFYFLPHSRERLRKLWKAEDRIVATYIGKLGDLYYTKELVSFFSGLYKMNSSFFFVVATRYCHNEIEQWFEECHIPAENYMLDGFLSNNQVKEFISASDIGISAVPPSPSQKFRSPTKVAEYLMCGLPYITCAGVSEDDLYAEKYGVGVVVNGFSEEEAKRKYPSIEGLLQQDKDMIRKRCRETGIEYRSQRKVVKIIKENLRHLL
jgi:hypothetical protein